MDNKEAIQEIETIKSFLTQAQGALEDKDIQLAADGCVGARFKLEAVIKTLSNTFNAPPITVKGLRIYFTREYPHINHDLSNLDMQAFLDSHNDIKDIKRMADLFSDYILANNLQTDIQE